MDQVFVQNDKRYADFNITLKNTKDGKAIVINSTLSYFVELLAEVTKVNILVQNDDQDFQYSNQLLETKINTCNTSSKGQRASLFAGMFTDYILKAVDVKYSCPFKKNFKRAISNQIITDVWLPAIPVEQKFKLKFRVFSRIKERKGYINTFNCTIYGRIKK